MPLSASLDRIYLKLSVDEFIHRNFLKMSFKLVCILFAYFSHNNSKELFCLVQSANVDVTYNSINAHCRINLCNGTRWVVIANLIARRKNKVLGRP